MTPPDDPAHPHDDVLRAFLNGTLSEDQDARLSAELAENPALERRIMALDPAARPVAKAMAHLPDPARIKDLQRQLRAPDTSPIWRPTLSLVAALIAGLGIGWALNPAVLSGPTSDWRTEVARYQALYVPETVAQLNSDDATLAVQFQRATTAVGLALDPGPLGDLDGVTLARAQVLGFETDPLVQIVFRDAAGTPLALCLMAGPSQDSGPQQLAGLASYSWSGPSHRFLLIGGQDQKQITDLARRIQAAAFPAT